MKTPPVLLGASLAFWGWMTGQLALGTVLGALLEGSRLTRRRFDLTAKDFNRAADLCGVIFVVVFLNRYIFGSGPQGQSRGMTAQWAPLVFYLLMLAQVYSTSQEVSLGAIFYTVRRKIKRHGEKLGRTVDISYYYLGLVILASAAANVRTVRFYAGLTILTGWALWANRPKRYSAAVWAAVLSSAVIIGFAGQAGLHRLHLWIEESTLRWYEDFLMSERDPFKSATSLGDIGELKLSGRIQFRVRALPTFAASGLLREAAYNRYRLSKWFAYHPEFRSVAPAADGAAWTFGREEGPSASITVSSYLSRGRAMLKLPMGASQVEGLQIVKMERNKYGAVRVEEGPNLITYQVKYGAKNFLDAPPVKEDLEIPEEEKAVLEKISDELDLKGLAAQEAAERLTAFFVNEFKYSLDLVRSDQGVPPLEDFLLNTRVGHCEYFASATVLLLRTAGIPSRYGTGYLAAEYSRLEGQFVVRARHAHAWTLYWADGAWHDLDTTPPNWLVIEDEAASSFSEIADLWDWLTFRFSQWRWRERTGKPAQYLVWLLIPLLGALLFTLRKRMRKRLDATGKSKISTALEVPGADSAFYTVVEKLEESGYVRQPGETLRDWIDRIDDSRTRNTGQGGLRDELDPLLILHYRLRFDPRGVSAADREALNKGVRCWLAEWALNDRDQA